MSPTIEQQTPASSTTVAEKPTWGKVALGSFSSPDQQAFIHRVYGWMCVGLIVSAAVAYWVAVTPVIAQVVIGNEIVFFVLLGAELVAVFTLASLVHKLSSTLSSLIFIIYAALSGLTLSVIFFVYQIGSIAEVFLLTAGLFGVMSLYGYFTKTDLTTVGNFAIMALLGLVVAMLINLFFQNDLAGFILAAIGVLVFVVLTAYDTQKLKWLYALGGTEGADGEKKEAINGALTLYLDFINLFLDLLRLFGKRR